MRPPGRWGDGPCTKMEMGVQLLGAAVGGARLKLPTRLSWQAPFQSPPAAGALRRLWTQTARGPRGRTAPPGPSVLTSSGPNRRGNRLKGLEKSKHSQEVAAEIQPLCTSARQKRGDRVLGEGAKRATAG